LKEGGLMMARIPTNNTSVHSGCSQLFAVAVLNGLRADKRGIIWEIRIAITPTALLSTALEGILSDPESLADL
jgi:hypothetical protein